MDDNATELERVLDGCASFIAATGHQPDRIQRACRDAVDALQRLRAERDKLRAVNAKLVEALRTIQKWDCLNPPQSELCTDFPWLKQIVDTALTFARENT